MTRYENHCSNRIKDEIVSRVTDSLYAINIDGRESNISTERLKPALLAAQHQTETAQADGEEHPVASSVEKPVQKRVTFAP